MSCPSPAPSYVGSLCTMSTINTPSAATNVKRAPCDIEEGDRPVKRARTDSASSQILAEPPTPTSAQLLLALPKHLLTSYPPTSPQYPSALALSITAFRRVLNLSVSSLDPSTEIHALTSLVELSLHVLTSFSPPTLSTWRWALGLEPELERSLTRALALSTTHPTLRLYRPHLTFLNVTFLERAGRNPKLVKKIVFGLLGEVKEGKWNDYPRVVYDIYLGVVDWLVSRGESEDREGRKALELMQDVLEVARRRGDRWMALSLSVIHLRLLFFYSHWTEAGQVLRECEDALNLFPTTNPSKEQDSTTSESSTEVKALLASLKSHTLLFGVLYYCIRSNGTEITTRLDRLHAELDAGLLNSPNPTLGTVSVPLSDGSEAVTGKEEDQVVYVNMTPPTILTTLAYLVSAEAKRDAVGRKSKRRIFALEGIRVVERSMRRLSPCSSPTKCMGLKEMEELERSMVRIKAEFLLEVVSVGLMRSEFEDVRERIDELISLSLKNEERFGIWDEFSARVTLAQAQLHHALGQAPQALRGYQVARGLAEGTLHTGMGVCVLHNQGIPKEDDDKREEDLVENFLQSPDADAMQTPTKTPTKGSLGFVRSGAPTPPTFPHAHSVTSRKRKRVEDALETPTKVKTIPPVPPYGFATPVKRSSANSLSTLSSLPSTPSISRTSSSASTQPPRTNTYPNEAQERRKTALLAQVGECLLRLGMLRIRQQDRQGEGLFPFPEEWETWEGWDEEDELDEIRLLADGLVEGLSDLGDGEGERGEYEPILLLMRAISCFCQHGLGGPGDYEGSEDGEEGERKGLEAKGWLRSLLQLTKTSPSSSSASAAVGGVGDGYMRALGMALVASFYVYTAEDHVQSMLSTCEMLASGLGAPASKPAPQSTSQQGAPSSSSALGNVPLRLWVSKQQLELAQRSSSERGQAGQGVGVGKEVKTLQKVGEILRRRNEEMKSVL